MQIDHKCPHTRGEVSDGVCCSNYKPIGEAELRALLHYAATAGQDADAVLCRLIQAIPGTVCPREINGPVAEKHNLLETHFNATFHEGATQVHVEFYMDIFKAYETALKRIALNTSGDLPAQIIAGDILAGREPGS